MQRQFDGLPMERQLAYAREYCARFGARLRLGAFPCDPVRVDGVPSEQVLISNGDRETLHALRELDARCHDEWRTYLESLPDLTPIPARDGEMTEPTQEKQEDRR